MTADSTTPATVWFWKTARRGGRVLAAYAIILVGGIVCGGLVNVCIGLPFIIANGYEPGFLEVDFLEGAAFGGISAFYLGLLLCIPVSFCRFPTYVFCAAAVHLAWACR